MKNRNSKEEIQNDIDFLIEMEEQADRATNFTGKYSGQSDTGSSHHLMTLIANWKGELLALSKGDQTKNNTMKENETKPFPKYMQTEFGLEVLMTESGKGIVTKGAKEFSFGETWAGWYMDLFTDIESPEVVHPEEKPIPVGVWKCIKDLLEALMTKDGPVIVTKGAKEYKLGYESADWSMCIFTDIESPEVAHPEEKPTPVGVWKCIKDLTMQVGWIAFKKGRLYEQLGWANRSVLLSNEKGEPHSIDEDCTEYFYQVK